MTAMINKIALTYNGSGFDVARVLCGEPSKLGDCFAFKVAGTNEPVCEDCVVAWAPGLMEARERELWKLAWLGWLHLPDDDQGKLLATGDGPPVAIR
jgi:hypothetical protein